MMLLDSCRSQINQELVC